jgi:branched-chain amino acid transport system ATP-binding protein
LSSALEVRDLTGGYTAASILRSISLEVASGEIVGLLGANGAGKTSLLRAISGTLPVCRGSVVVNGHALSGKRSWNRVRAGLVHVPEGRHIFRAMTVRENLAVAGLVGRASTKIEEVFDLFPRLRERQSQLAGSLSGGEQQMLAIGRALMTSPSVLVVDEMSAGLAPVLVEHLVEGLIELGRRGIAILLVEQSPLLIADAVDRVYLLEHGSVVGSGTLDELGGPERLAELYLGV